MENNLGFFKKEKTETKVVLNEESPEESYVSFRFYNGSLCDLNQKPREIEIRVSCPPKDKPKSDVNVINLPHHISQVLEPVSCEYILRFQSEYLCSLPQFQKKEKVAKNVIDCYPLDGVKFTPNPKYKKPVPRTKKPTRNPQEPIKLESKLIDIDLTGNSKGELNNGVIKEAMAKVIEQFMNNLGDIGEVKEVKIIQKGEEKKEENPKETKDEKDEKKKENNEIKEEEVKKM